MAITLPLSIAAFASRLVVEDGHFRLNRYEETSGTAKGEDTIAEIAAPKWSTELALCPMTIGEAGEIKALVERLGSSGQVYLFDPWRPYPRADPTGSGLGSSSPTIHTIGGDNRSLRIAGLPAGYVLSAGDFLAFDRPSPTRRSAHRSVETVTASGLGLTPLFEVEPQLKAGTVTGLAVTLRKPAAKMRIRSFDPGRARGNLIFGMSFTAVEAY